MLVVLSVGKNVNTNVIIIKIRLIANHLKIIYILTS